MRPGAFFLPTGTAEVSRTQDEDELMKEDGSLAVTAAGVGFTIGTKR
jgi:hypothetical protein